MRIASSNVAMASSHQETKFSYKQSMTMEAAASKNLAGAIFYKIRGNGRGRLPDQYAGI